jgi:hypothetical protein
MSHILEIDRSRTRASKRRIERAPDGRITSEKMAASPGQFADLGTELAATVDGEVRFDPGDRALYATDASNYRQVPIGVAIPRSAAAIASTVELCRKFEAPIVMRGGGTSLAGQGCNFAVLIDCSKYLNRVVAIDTVEVMKSGCCGMAGAFGFERDKYDVSITAAERAMMPLIRDAASDTVILADGFSCREQIEQCSGRRTRHIAELLANVVSSTDAAR